MESMVSTQESVEFNRGQTTNIIARPRTKLEHSILDRLSIYIEKVTGKPVKINENLDEVQNSLPVIFLANKRFVSPIPLHIPKGSDEAFCLVTSKFGTHPIVVAAGRTDKGLKRAVSKADNYQSTRRESTCHPSYKSLSETMDTLSGMGALPLGTS